MYGYENAASGLKKMFTAQVGSIICVVLMMIPFIGVIGLIGVAFTLTIVQMVVSVIGNLAGTGVFATVFSVVNDILALLVVRAVCLSVAEVMDQLNQRVVADKGRSVWKINLGCYVADIVLTILAVIPVLGTVLAVAGSVVTVILSLVAGIMYIMFLSKSYQALEN